MEIVKIKISKVGIKAAKDKGLGLPELAFLLYCSKYPNGACRTYKEIAPLFLLCEKQLRNLATELKNDKLLFIKQTVRNAEKKVTELGRSLCDANNAAKVDFFICEIDFDDELTLHQNLYAQFLINRISKSELKVTTGGTVSHILAHKNVKSYATKLVSDFFEVDARTAKAAVGAAIKHRFIYLSKAQNTEVLSVDIITTEEIADYRIGKQEAIDADLVNGAALINKFLAKNNRTVLNSNKVDALVKALQAYQKGEAISIEQQTEKEIYMGDEISKETLITYKQLLNVLDDDTLKKVRDVKTPSEKALFYFQQIADTKDATGESLYSFQDVQLVFWEKIYLWSDVSRFQKNLNTETIFFHFEEYLKDAKIRQQAVETALAHFVASSTTPTVGYKELAAAWLRWRLHAKFKGVVYYDAEIEKDALRQLWTLCMTADKKVSTENAVKFIEYSIVGGFKAVYATNQNQNNFKTKKEINDEALRRAAELSQALKDGISERLRNQTY